MTSLCCGTWVCKFFNTVRTPNQLNDLVESLSITLRRSTSLNELVFYTMATDGGYSSLQELVIDIGWEYYDVEPLSLDGSEYLSSFINQRKNLRTVSLQMTGDELVPIVETLSRTKVQSLQIDFCRTPSQQNGFRQLGTALERCTCITQLHLEFPSYVDHVEFFQILLVESIPKIMTRTWSET